MLQYIVKYGALCWDSYDIVGTVYDSTGRFRSRAIVLWDDGTNVCVFESTLLSISLSCDLLVVGA